MQALEGSEAERYVSAGHWLHAPVAPTIKPKRPGWHSHWLRLTGELSAGQARQDSPPGGTTSLAVQAWQVWSVTMRP
jgi:hypothetical protein